MSVGKRHFDRAFQVVKPSVSGREKKKYNLMRKQYSSEYSADVGVLDKDLPKTGPDASDELMEDEAINTEEEEEVVLQMEEDDNSVATVDKTDNATPANVSTSAYSSLVKAKPLGGTVLQERIQQDAFRTSTSGLRFLERMYVRIKDSSESAHKGSQGHIANITQGEDTQGRRCSITLDDIGVLAEGVPLDDLEPFTPDFQEWARLLIPGSCDTIARVVFLDEDTDEVTVEMRLEDGVKNLYGTLDNVCKVMPENNGK